MTSYVTPKKNSAFIVYVGLVSQSSRPQFQSNPTLAAGDAKVSIDGAALANLGTLPAVTPASSKSVKVTLSAAEMNGDNIIVILSDAAGAEWDDKMLIIQTTAQTLDELDTIVDSILEDTAALSASSISGPASGSREIQESPFLQGADEILNYTVTSTPWAASPTSVSVKIFSFDPATSAYTDVTSTNMSGSASVSGDVITTPYVTSLTIGTRYRVEVKFTVSGNTYEPYLWIYCER